MVRLKNVNKDYDNGAKALKSVSLEIKDGEFVFLVGPSGSGKSTIVKLITGEIAPTQGDIMVNGYDLCAISRRKMPYMRRTIGVIFQDFRLIQNKTVFENVALAMRVIGRSNKEIASELFLSEGTVRNYLSSLLDKLQLRDRTQLAVYYYTEIKR